MRSVETTRSVYQSRCFTFFLSALFYFDLKTTVCAVLRIASHRSSPKRGVGQNSFRSKGWCSGGGGAWGEMGVPRVEGIARPWSPCRRGLPVSTALGPGVFSSITCFEILGFRRNLGLVLLMSCLKTGQQTGLQTRFCLLLAVQPPS